MGQFCNVLTFPWIPFRRKSGEVVWCPPSAITDGIDSDPIMEIAAPRPDFAGAIAEFTVGILSTGFAVGDEAEWRMLWEKPPTPTVVAQRFSSLLAAFNLDGDGPRFLQDISAKDFADAREIPIEQLLIDAPGDQTTKFNKDLFIKRDRVERMGRSAAVMALITLQTYAPGGGQGHRTSMRGGGPLTTLVDPSDMIGGGSLTERPLWYKLWANVSTKAQWAEQLGSGNRELKDKFPWLAPTRTSEKGKPTTTPQDGHPLQAYFGMPRRIRLKFDGPGRCDLTGREDEQTVTVFQMKNYGIDYSGWTHPLSPYYQTKKNEEWLPVHGQPAGISWRDWLSLAFSADPDGLRRSAEVVQQFKRDRAEIIGAREVRLHVFGYDMDNMKSRGWIESQLPLLIARDDLHGRLLFDVAHRLSDAADIAAGELMTAGKTALADRPADIRGDISQYRSAVWDGTESRFFDLIRRVALLDSDAVDDEVIGREFLKHLEVVTLGIFDRWCPMAAAPGEHIFRLVRARYSLACTFGGRSRAGEKLYAALRLPAPTPAPRKRGKKQRAKEKI